MFSAINPFTVKNLRKFILVSVFCQCRTMSCKLTLPLYSLTARLKTARMQAGMGSTQKKCMPSYDSFDEVSFSLRCFSPTTRWLFTVNSPSKNGCGKPCPQTCCSRLCAMLNVNSEGVSRPSVSIILVRSPGESKL